MTIRFFSSMLPILTGVKSADDAISMVYVFCGLLGLDGTCVGNYIDERPPFYTALEGPEALFFCISHGGS